MARKKDITETGPKALRGIRNPDLYSVSKDNPVDAILSDLDREMLKNDLGKAAYRNYDVSTGHVGYSALQDPSLFEPQVTPLDYGSSKYDTGLLLNPDQGDIQDQRANSQSGFLKVVNGLAKGAVLAGTTFLDGTVGLVYGTGAAVNQGRWSALWDNDFSRAMQKINDVSEELMPNYYTQDEQQNPWDHIFSANFIGDKFIKNLGFTVGALYSGGVISGGVRGIGAAISTAKAFTKATAHVATGVGVFTSALNEGRIEAINNSRDWFNLHAMKLEDGYKQRIAALREEYEANAGKNLVGDAEHGYVDPAYIKYQEGLRKEEKAYRASLAELNEKKLHMGNVDLLMNLPILMASNFVQFARFYANGFNTGRKVFNVLGDPGKYVAGTGKKRLAVELGKRGLAEGTEEISQRAASEISGDYYSTDVMNFYKSKTNREAEMETLDFMKSFATGINKTVNDGSAWEEFLIGALTGIMGVPKFRSMYNAQGKLQSPVTLYNESWEKWKENKEIRAKEAELVDALNTRFNSEDFLNYYQGLIRNKKFQIDMNRAIEEGDEFGFKNAEHAQLISDIIMFDKAGKLNDLKAAMGVVDDVSDKNLESIIKNTTTKDDSGKLAGPFAQYASVDKETGEIVANFGSEQDKKDMATKLEENNKTITNTIKEYQKRKDNFIARYGDKFTDDQLSELTWMNLQLDNWAKRSEEMTPAIKDELKHILGSLDEANRINQELGDSEGREHADLTDLYRMFGSNVRNLSDLIQRVKSYTNLSDKSLARILTSNPKTAETFIELIDRESDSVDKDDVIGKLRDMVKMGKAADTYTAKLSEYLKVPEKLTEDEKKADDEAIKQATTEAITNVKDTLSKATTPKEFRDAADTLKRENPEESDNINQAIQNLANEGNQQAKAYQDINQYIVDVNAALTAANLSPQTLLDASNILNTLASDSNNLEELMNPEAVVDDEMFLEEGVNSLDDAKNRNVAAQYALSKAKEKVNNGNKFKDRFSATYQTPTDNEKGTGTGVDEETTGDSGTPTIPDTGGTEVPTSTEEAPVGDSSIDDIKKDNKELNESVEDPVPPKRGEVKQYYRPAVPELHIEASKRGDFRPFVDVVREREGADFSAIYNYLVKNDVFKYLNEGNLHEDDELGFMIDPEFEREVEGKEWHKKPTIFIINKRDGHIVGSLDESEGSIKKFEGLKELEDRIISEYNNKKSQNTADSSSTPDTLKVPRGYESATLKDGGGVQNSEELNKVLLSKNGHNIFQMYSAGRTFVIANINGVVIPFYMSAHGTDGKIAGSWYPFFGMTGTWLVKGSIDENGFMSYSPEIDRVTKLLNNSLTIDHEVSIKELAKNNNSFKPFTFKDRFKIPEGSEDLMFQGHDIVYGTGKRADAVYVEEITGIDASRVVNTNKPDPGWVSGTEHIRGILNSITNIANTSTPTGRFVATPTTKVSQIMVGKVPYSEDERNLKDVLESYMQSGKEVFFGVIKNGVLNTNGKVDPSAVMPLKDTSNRKGRLYLLVPNGAGKYSPVAVRVKHFNTEEFNPADINLQDNTTMRNIKNAIKALSEVTSKEELDGTVSTLAKVLYKGNLHIDFVDSAYGTGIRFTKIFRDSNGKEIYEEGSEGNRKRKEEVVTVDLTKKGNTIAVLGDDNQFHDVEPTQVPQEQVIKEITDTLLSFNLPIQISISDINTSSRYQGNVTRYNNGIIEAGLLTSNLTEMGTKSTWFTTDYFDAQGNPHKAINPVYKASPSAETPSQGAINGVQITSASDDKIYFVDLQTNTIRDSEGKVIPTTDTNSVLIDVAWAQKMYGDATEGVNMFNNKVITPSGKALDRTTQKYLDDRGLQLLKQDIADMQNRAELVEKANKILEKINEDQSKVDKARTDQEYYYILEDDGQYHQYERVHKALGPNWIGESTSNANSSRALVAGSAVDSVIRQYFMTDNPSTIQRPDKLTKGAFNQLLDALSKIKARMEANGERFLTNNIVLYYKYSDGRRVAGEVDILAINKNGRYSIYDVKTSARSFSHQYFTEKGPKQVVSTKDYYTLQLSAYQNLFESKYDSDIRELGIIPFVLGYYQNTDVVNTVVNEPNISITYNPNVNVPLVDTTQHNRSEDKVNTQNTLNNAQAAINALNLDQKSDSNENDESTESTEDDIFALRKTTDSSYEVWDKEQELAWLEKALPQLSREDRLQFVKGLIKVGNDGVYAWGKLDKGIVTLSDIAAKGTAYHEAFHVVFNYLMDENDREALLSEYSKKLPNTDNVELEEALAEDFREFVMQGGRDTRSLGRKIIDFFKSLFIKTKYWKDFRPSSIYYFKRINDSRYANGKFGINKNTRARKVEYTQEMKDILAKAPRDSEGNLLAPNNNKSNLEERQYALVRTKAFKEWFGDWENDPDNASKIRDENDEPLVVYRAGEINEDGTLRTRYKAYYFTPVKSYAEQYAKQEDVSVHSFFLKASSINDISGQGMKPIIRSDGKKVSKRGLFEMPWSNEDVNIILEGKEAAWSDGEFLIPKPNQFKSATSNTGEFSTTNNDISHRLVDKGSSDNILKMRRDVQKFLDNFSITIKDINEFGGEEKLFDALNRTINIRSAEDISEGVGEAIAFMMQHSALMSQIISAKLMSESTTGSKSIRRSLRKRGDAEKFSSISDLDPEIKGRLIKEVGHDIAVQLRNFYNVESIKSEPKSLLSKLWKIIEEFFDKITPLAKARFRVLHNYTKNIVNSIALNDPSIVRTTDTKPGTTVKAARVNIAQALQENDYERDIIEFLNSKNIALAGSASIALEGTLYRPEENPLHDIDFNAASYSKEELDNVLREHFPNIKFIREINDGAEATTETYLVLDREFTTKPLKGKDSSIVELYDTTGNLIGQYVGSELSLKDGIRGKFLDFFLGKENNKYTPKVYNINGKPYLVSDYRNAFTAKITWARPKDVWDYNRFNYNEDFKLLQEQKIAQRKRVREKFKNARIIWGHPAIGKTTYLERNQDILEWDKEVNPKRFKFIRDQIDPEHKLDPTSKEYKNLQKDYMTNWKMHPEYIKFMTNEWETLKRRAINENKRLFASPLPLLEIGADDFDLVINMPEKAFIERNTGRGAAMLSTLDWKQALNDELVKIDPDKVITTDKYFSDFIRENLGATWGTLTDEEVQSLTLRGWTEEMFNSVSQIERDHLLKCS